MFCLWKVVLKKRSYGLRKITTQEGIGEPGTEGDQGYLQGVTGPSLHKDKLWKRNDMIY